MRCSFPGFLGSSNPCPDLLLPRLQSLDATTGEGNIPVSDFSHPSLPLSLKTELLISLRTSQCYSSFQHLNKHRQFSLPNFPSDKLSFSRQVSVRSFSLTVLSLEKSSSRLSHNAGHCIFLTGSAQDQSGKKGKGREKRMGDRKETGTDVGGRRKVDFQERDELLELQLMPNTAYPFHRI